MSLDAYRKDNPQYDHIPDDKLANALYEKHYSEAMSYGDFSKKMGLTAPIQQPKPMQQQVQQIQPQQIQQPSPSQPAQMVQQVKEKGDFWQNVRQNKQQASASMDKYVDRAKKGEISTMEASLGVVSEMVKTGGNQGIEMLKAVTPDGLEELFVEWMGNEVKANLDTPYGRLIVDGLEAYQGFKETNPRAAMNIENTLTAGSAALGARALFKKPSLPKGLGEKVLPKRTELVKKQLSDRMRKTKAGNFEVIHTPDEKAMMKELAKVKGVNGKSLIHDDIINVNKVINDKTKGLSRRLKADNIQIRPAEVQTAMGNNLRVQFNNNPLYAKFKSKSPDKMPVVMKNVMDEAIQIVNNNKKNLNGLLKSRKQLDDLFNASKVFKEGRGMINTPRSRAYKEARDTLNDLIIQKAPYAKESLRSTHLLIRAKEIMKTKVGGEGVKRSERIVKAIEDKPVIGRMFGSSTRIRRN